MPLQDGEGQRVKKCQQCEQEKPTSEFNKEERNADQLSNKCKECRKAGMKQVRLADRCPSDTAACKLTAKSLERTEFFSLPQCATGYRCACLRCTSCLHSDLSNTPCRPDFCWMLS